eukprot:Gb_31925 [translate_table: standard]
MSSGSSGGTGFCSAQSPRTPEAASGREDAYISPRRVSVSEIDEVLKRPRLELPLLAKPSLFKSLRRSPSPRKFPDLPSVTGKAIEIMDRLDGSSEVIEFARDDEEIRPLMPSPSADGNSAVEVAMDVPHIAKMSIFSVSYGAARAKGKRDKQIDNEFSGVVEFLLWAWGGSRYSGMICMALSSLTYSIMGLLVDFFTVTLVPSFETIFIRCTVILVAAFIWLKKAGQPLFGLPHVRHLLMARAIAGYLSLLGFFYSITVLPLHDAIVLNFTTPFMAAILGRVILQENWRLTEIGGSVCSFLGLFLILQPIPFFQDQIPESSVSTHLYIPGGRYYIHAILIAVLSAASGGANYCFIRAGAKASEQPLTTVFAFVAFSCPAAAICMLSFQKFVVPGFVTFIGMIIIGLLAFIAEVLLARGLQLEKAARATAVLYVEAFASHILGIMFLGQTPSVVSVFGATLIVISTMSVAYFGNDKLPES